LCPNPAALSAYTELDWIRFARDRGKEPSTIVREWLRVDCYALEPGWLEGNPQSRVPASGSAIWPRIQTAVCSLGVAGPRRRTAGLEIRALDSPPVEHSDCQESRCQQSANYLFVSSRNAR